MAGTGTGKSKSENLTEKEEEREEKRRIIERDEQQDVNQGSSTGTHDSVRHGVDWGPAYTVRTNPRRKGQKVDDPDKKPRDSKEILTDSSE